MALPEPDTVLNMVGLLVLALIVYAVVRIVLEVVGGVRKTANARKHQEAFFQASFPELQPWFHPEKVLQFVSAWQARKPRAETVDWNDPPGFGLPRARLMPKGEKGQLTELLDAAGKVVSSFVLQDNPEGGVIRIGPGKLTVNIKNAAVRYWHPQREFKWSRLKGWRVLNALSDRGIDSSDSGMSFSSDGSSSASTTAAAAAAGAVVVAGAGGAFDGGGSSESWSGGAGESRTSY